MEITIILDKNIDKIVKKYFKNRQFINNKLNYKLCQKYDYNN